MKIYAVSIILGFVLLSVSACEKPNQIDIWELEGTWEPQIMGWACGLGCTLHYFQFDDDGTFKLTIKRSVDYTDNSPCSAHRTSYVSGRFKIDENVIRFNGKFMHSSYLWVEPDCVEGAIYKHSTEYSYQDGILILNSAQNFSDPTYLRKI